jgi:hypothetical protein
MEPDSQATAEPERFGSGSALLLYQRYVAVMPKVRGR